jgi:Asp-tRNA(Asn)/Glu-tRNA(Gln) amidotransferase A subunit family amidase
VSALFTVVRFTSLFNLTRHPTISLPAGLTERGMPVGAQPVEKHFRDPELLELARTVENAIAFTAGAVLSGRRRRVTGAR